MAKTAKKRKTPNSPTVKPGELSKGERLFALEYVKDFNGTRAATDAGYAAGSAHTSANRLLKREKVQAEIARLAKKHEDEIEISAIRTLEELARIAFVDVRKVVTWKGGDLTLLDSDKLDPAVAAAISEVRKNADGEIIVKFHSKPQALALLARHHNLLVERHEVDLNIRISQMTENELNAEIAARQADIEEQTRALGTIEGTAEEVTR